MWGRINCHQSGKKSSIQTRVRSTEKAILTTDGAVCQTLLEKKKGYGSKRGQPQAIACSSPAPSRTHTPLADPVVNYLSFRRAAVNPVSLEQGAMSSSLSSSTRLVVGWARTKWSINKTPVKLYGSRDQSFFLAFSQIGDGFLVSSP